MNNGKIWKGVNEEDIKKTLPLSPTQTAVLFYIGVEDGRSIVGINGVDGVVIRISYVICDSIEPDITLFVSYETKEIDGKTIIKVIVEKKELIAQLSCGRDRQFKEGCFPM